MVDTSSLARALASLDVALARALADPKDEVVRDGTIQRFEFTYELTWRTLARHLHESAPSPSALSPLSFPELIRQGSSAGLLRSDLPRWVAFRKARGTTSHAYDPEKAREVFAQIPDFAEEVRFFLQRLGERESLA